MLLAIPYLLIAKVCAELVEQGSPGWLHLVVLWAIWNMLKMLWIGPVSAVLLIRARVRESVTARRERASLLAEADDAEERALVERDRCPVRCENSGTDPATPASTDRSTACDHRRAHGLVTDSESCGDLSERHPTRIELGGVLSDRVRKLRSARCQPRLPSYLPHGAAVHVEPRRQLPHGHAIGVLGDQLDSIGDAQTGLRLTRILTHGTALIGDLSTPSARPTSPRTPYNAGDQRSERLSGV